MYGFFQLNLRKTINILFMISFLNFNELKIKFLKKGKHKWSETIIAETIHLKLITQILILNNT